MIYIDVFLASLSVARIHVKISNGLLVPCCAVANALFKERSGVLFPMLILSLSRISTLLLFSSGPRIFWFEASNREARIRRSFDKSWSMLLLFGFAVLIRLDVYDLQKERLVAGGSWVSEGSGGVKFC